jgi:hypothetical protein
MELTFIAVVGWSRIRAKYAEIASKSCVALQQSVVYRGMVVGSKAIDKRGMEAHIACGVRNLSALSCRKLSWHETCKSSDDAFYRR